MKQTNAENILHKTFYSETNWALILKFGIPIKAV